MTTTASEKAGEKAAGAAEGSTGRGRSVGLTLEPVWEAGDRTAALDLRGGVPPSALRGRFPGELVIPLPPDRPAVIANFVSSIDGVVALAPDEPASGGGEISGFSESDRFMMAMLRTLADAVVVGAGTVRVGREHEWTARRVQPSLAAAFGEWRAALGLAPQPTTVVVTSSGSLDPQHAGLTAADVPALVATTRAGAERLEALRPGLAANVRVEVVAEDGHVPAGGVVDAVRRALPHARLILVEGGPHLFGEWLDAGLVDELFLTVAPQVLGRGAVSGERPGGGERPGAAAAASIASAGHRLGLVEGTRFGDGRDRWASLRSIRRAGDDLFLRYRFAA